MGDIKIRIEGLSELISRVEKLPIEIQEEISGEIIDSVMRINGKQRRLAPKDQGGLARGIGYERKQGQNKAHFELFSNSEQSGYMEFGTKSRIDIPSNLTSIAMQFKGAGIKSKLKAKEAIYAWCKRHGIDKKGWWFVYMSIMKFGVRPHPFFFKHLFDEAPLLIERITSIVNKYSAKPVGVSVIKPGDFVRNNQTITI